MVIACIVQSGDLGYDPNMEHGLIAPASDQDFSSWGCSDSLIGTTSADIGTGVQNTAAILAGCTDTSIAAKVCDDLNLNGLDVWYLPSLNGLDKLLTNQAAVGGFSGFYQNSTEQDGTVGLGKSFINGTNTFFGKTAVNKVRCVRSF